MPGVSYGPLQRFAEYNATSGFSTNKLYYFDPKSPNCLNQAGDSSLFDFLGGSIVLSSNNATTMIPSANGSIGFNGTTNFLTKGGNLSAGWHTISVSAWFNTTKQATSAAQTIIGEWSGGADWVLTLDSTTGGYLNLYFNTYSGGGGTASNNPGWVYNIAPVTSNTWHEVFLTYSPNNLNVYLDGAVVYNNASANGIVYPGTTYYLKVGAATSASEANPNFYFRGQIGIMRIYNVEITSSEVEYMFNSFRGRYGV